MLVLIGGKHQGRKKADTELWDGKTWKPHHPLPAPMAYHCVVKINATTVFFIADIGSIGTLTKLLISTAGLMALSRQKLLNKEMVMHVDYTRIMWLLPEVVVQLMLLT